MSKNCLQQPRLLPACLNASTRANDNEKNIDNFEQKRLKFEHFKENEIFGVFLFLLSENCP
jgi:hypothetical protein